MGCGLSNDEQTIGAVPLRIAGQVDRGSPVTIYVDGASRKAHAGESVATALLADGQTHLRYSPRAGAARGLFCHMGACQECVVVIDGIRRAACQTSVREGMSVETGGRL